AGSREALMYADRRAVLSEPILERFELGFGDGRFARELPAREDAARAELLREYQAIGVLGRGEREIFTGSLIVPIGDGRGAVVSLYGRRSSPPPEGAPEPRYLGPYRGVFNVEALRSSKTIIVCEAILDCLSYVNGGYAQATTTYGVSGVT